MKQNAVFFIGTLGPVKYSTFDGTIRFSLILSWLHLYQQLVLTDAADQEQRLALIRELETLIHVGRHPNIVSLVGACTFEGMVLCSISQIQTSYSQHHHSNLDIGFAYTMVV